MGILALGVVWRLVRDYPDLRDDFRTGYGRLTTLELASSEAVPKRGVTVSNGTLTP